MKKIIKIFLILFALSGILAGSLNILYRNARVDIAVSNTVNTFPLTSQQKLEDFNYLYETMKSSFPYFKVKQRQFGTDWLSRYDDFKEQVLSATSDLEYYRVLKTIVSQLQNGHTNIIEPDEYKKYVELYRKLGPWNQVLSNTRVKERYAYWEEIVTKGETYCIPVLFRYIEGKYVADGGYAGGNLDQIGLPKGSVLDSVDGIEVDEYIQSLKSQRILSIDRVRNKPMLKWFAIQTEKEIQLGITLADNTKTNISVSPVAYKPSEEKNVIPEHLYTAEIFDEYNAAYLKVPSFNPFYIDKDREGILNFLQSISGCDALIIDIRGNGGGSNNYWMNNLVAPLISKELKSEAFLLFRNSDYLKPFIKQKLFLKFHTLKPLGSLPGIDRQPEYFEGNDGVFVSSISTVKPVKQTEFSGEIYLLVDKYVYSAAEAFSIFAKSTGWATLVGTDTGGDGIGFDPVVVALPHSGLVVRFPGDMGVAPDGKPNEETATLPDIYIEQTNDDYLKKVKMQSNGEDINTLKNRMLHDTILRRVIDEIVCIRKPGG